ncbi:MAG TPA: redoxin domain-containing protein [Anaerolineaceae bacterium]|nr:redoxin domain-containing protein [Anaerolineaceae bacterium]
MVKPAKNLWILSVVLLAACASLPASGSVEKPIDQATPEMSNQPGSPTQPLTHPPGADASQFPDLGAAPELQNRVWINSDHPLRLADLRGKVVLLEMWTFGCINCQHVIPSLKDWYQKYADEGLVIIGNHFPEFDYERDLNNVKEAVKEAGIQYPVAQDNEGKTWSAYNNLYWPTIYLIDKTGHIRYRHVGEGNYQVTEAAIQALLKETAPGA